ncbi:tyrosine-type recombinase/integrase [Sphingosinicella soli]|uniref:Integrase DNA-binding domain-containing protein n=1 Tax=Sphingosinicella soli TaxID=333708 RepID=A0A7W7F6Z1_9SPHN|nr:integrase arm-type DNA-binding domain-containing protein [Sphingosinicella soli]MBB4632856.1 hypothetical protein [Sphingosinicella soli]
MLSDAKLRAAKPRANAYKLTDSNRLYLLVTPSGGKLWRWSYQFGGKQKTMAFGAYPVVSLLEAREKRDEARAILAQGKDPVIAKKLLIHENLAAAQNTFERIARKWHEVTKAQWARVHADDVLRSLERDVFPVLGPLPVSEIPAPLVLDVLRARSRVGAPWRRRNAYGNAYPPPSSMRSPRDLRSMIHRNGLASS